jgi:hypothetical protein
MAQCLPSSSHTFSQAIRKQEIWVVHPHTPRLSSTNVKACTKFLSYLEWLMQTHRMADQLSMCEKQITSYLVPPDVKHHMQCLNSRTVETQQGAERQCCQMYIPALSFREPIWVVHFQRQAYQALARSASLQSQQSNAVKQALKAGTPRP